MKISLAQVEIVSGKPSTNLSKMKFWIERASKCKSDLVVFPEMSDTGYDMQTILEVASEWDKGVAPSLCNYAKQNNINVIAGISERDSGKVFNSIIVINRSGEVVGRYRKTHLITAAPMHEDRYLGFGNELVICKIDGLSVGLMTCYEIRFPEIARKLTFSGADILIIPAAFPLVRLPHWDVLTRARAIENQIYVAATSRIGKDSEYSLQFCGTSTIYDPYGVSLASSSQIHEELVSADIDLDVTKNVREQIKVHQDIRNNLYANEVVVYG